MQSLHRLSAALVLRHSWPARKARVILRWSLLMHLLRFLVVDLEQQREAMPSTTSWQDCACVRSPSQLIESLQLSIETCEQANNVSAKEHACARALFGDIIKKEPNIDISIIVRVMTASRLD